jgi:hypothetical protein
MTNEMASFSGDQIGIWKETAVVYFTVQSQLSPGETDKMETSQIIAAISQDNLSLSTTLNHYQYINVLSKSQDL